jgi:hypothetical protein
MTKQTNQQGDVIFEVSEIPSDAKPLTSNVVRRGEGHHAHVLDGDVQLFDRDGTIYVRVGPGGATIQHERVGGGVGEHNPQTIAPGTYRTPSVVEWNPWNQEARRVQD